MEYLIAVGVGAVIGVVVGLWIVVGIYIIKVMRGDIF